MQLQAYYIRTVYGEQPSKAPDVADDIWWFPKASHYFNCLVACRGAVGTISAASAYVSKRQPLAVFLKPCSLRSATGDTCLGRMVTKLFQHRRNGRLIWKLILPTTIISSFPWKLKVYQAWRALDPFRVGKLSIAQRVPPNLDVQVGLRNMITFGLRHIEHHVSCAFLSKCLWYYTKMLKMLTSRWNQK